MSGYDGNIGIVNDSSLILHLDAANQKSYPSPFTGATWYDMSGNGNHGTLINGPMFNGSNAGGIQFDGVNDYTQLNRPTQLVTGGQITICLFAKWVSSGTTQTTIQELITNNHCNSPNQGFCIEDRPDLNKSVTFQTNWNTSSTTTVSTFQVGDGNWHFICGSNDTLYSKLYIDGNLNAQTVCNGLAAVQPKISIGYWQYGAEHVSLYRYLNGKIPLVLIYNRALSQQEITQNFNALRGRYGI